MSMNSTPKILPFIDEIERALSRSKKAWEKIKATWDKLDLNAIRKELTVFNQSVEWVGAKHNEISDMLKARVEYLESPEYRKDVESALRKAGLPFWGHYPKFEFQLFTCEINLHDEIAVLVYAGKKRKATALAPNQLAEWVLGQFKQITVGLDRSAFCRDLIRAYEIASKLAHKERKAIWGHPLSLSEIYKLLTLKESSKKNYTEDLFNYELTQLSRDVEVEFKEYGFELGYTRDHSGAYLLKDNEGRENRYTTLTIHKKEEEQCRQTDLTLEDSSQVNHP